MTADQLRAVLDEIRSDANERSAHIRARFEQIDARFARVGDELVAEGGHRDRIAELLGAEIRLVAEGQQNILDACTRMADAIAARVEQANAVLHESLHLSYRELDRRLRARDMR